MAFDPITSILNIGSQLIDKLIPDPQAKAKAKLDLLDMQQKGDLAQLAADTDLLKGQLAINQVEAGSTNLFVSGWRPFIGWVCGSGLAYNDIIAPFFVFIAHLYGSTVSPPVVSMADTMPLLMGLLGLGGLRTYEKVKGVTIGH